MRFPLNYNVQIQIHELKNCRFEENGVQKLANPFVRINLLDYTAATCTKEQTITTTYESQFNFYVKATEEELEHIMTYFTVFHAYAFSSEPIGKAVVNCDYVHRQPQHWFYREWVAIRHEKYPALCCGYLMISMGIYAPYNKIPIAEIGNGGLQCGDDDGVPEEPMISFKTFLLSINVYRGQNIFEPVVGWEKEDVKSTFIRATLGNFIDSTSSISGTSPEWNTSFSFVAFIPNHNPFLRIELGTGSAASTHQIVSVQSIHIEKAFYESIQPTWFKFYYKPKETFSIGNPSSWVSQASPFSSSLNATAYAGSRPCDSVIGPLPIEYIVFFEIYAISPLLETFTQVSVQLCVGIYSQTSSLIDYRDGIYIRNPSTGSFTTMHLLLPPIDKTFVFFIYILTLASGKTLWIPENLTRIAFARLSLAEFIGFYNSPRWITLQSVADMVNTFTLLISLQIGLASNLPKERPFREEMSHERFLLRVMIYEAINIPCIVDEELPSVYIKIHVGESYVKTQCIEQTIWPVWYEAFEMKLFLPVNLSLAPDIRIEVFSATPRHTKLGSFTQQILGLPKVWTDPPVWCDIINEFPTSNSWKGKVLCSFELIEEKEEDLKAYPFYDDIRPSVYSTNVHFCVVGIRLFERVNLPEILVAYGRDLLNSSQFLWCQNLGPPVMGENGNWTYMKSITLNVALPKRQFHLSFLEVSVYSSGYVSKNNDSPLGKAYILLSPFFPWLEDEEKKYTSQFFKLKTLDDTVTDANLNNISEVLQKSSKADTQQLEKDAQNLTIPRLDLDYANVRMYLTDDYVLWREDEQGNTLYTKEQANQNTRITQDTAEQSFNLNPNIDDGLSRFDLYIPEENTNNIDKEVICCELETELEANQLPFNTVPIFKSSTKGAPVIIGYLKYICYVETLDDISFEKEEQFQNKMELIQNVYKNAHNLVVRVYILSIAGLMLSSGGLKSMVYPWIKNGLSSSNDILPHNIQDKENSRLQAYFIEYNQCYVLNSNLPNHALLEVIFMLNIGGRDLSIGSTFIDIENRWFHRTYHELLKSGALPVEVRTLKLSNEIQSQGSIRVLVEIITYETLLTKAPITMAKVTPAEYEIRVVIWNVRGAPLEDNGLVSLFVRCVYESEDNSRITQDTDTHYNSRDGCATFNWRFVWNSRIPTNNNYITIQLCSSFLFPRPCNVLGISRIDLAYYFLMIRKKYTALYEIKKKWYPCYHPAHEGQAQGYVLLEISILPKKEAEFAPVGKGRNNPNRNPYLEEVLENRTYIDWKNVQEQITTFTTFASKTARKGCYITMAVFIGGIIFIILLLFR
ncbi:uncharacterized protein LOC128883599 isoform X2 [Hylaeus volcanicus]|uniref:uncharacterized protein LOC128883599 isoform X2 n=1 Tax=Hylaeus volcanicus TaxID=313075 RepID=UPI0023B7A66D|nr:uncharacterized protein LOC128883599 isoform X2 [Hylaeus volcanicus]